MRVFFFNVGHGEAIAIELSERKRVILRDCGSSSSKTPHSVSINKLATRCLWRHFPCDEFTYDAVLSHYHDDHYSGFEVLFNNKCDNLFDRAVIPYYDLNCSSVEPHFFVQIVLILMGYYKGKSRSSALKKYVGVLRVPLIMATLAQKITVGQQGLKIPQWGYNEFLWPPASSKANRMKSILSEYQKVDFPEKYLEKIQSQAAQVTELIAPVLEHGYVDGARTRLKQLDEILDEIVSLPKNINLSKLQSVTSKYLDDSGLIFEIGSDEKNALMLSDANDSEIQNMLKKNNKSNCTYTIIKASHHGNRGSIPLVANHIFAESVVCCTGKPGRGRLKQPEINYANVGKHVYCTGWDSSKWKNGAPFQVLPTCHIAL